MEHGDRNSKLAQLDPKDIFWGILMVVGCLGMIAFEMVLAKVTLGKW